MLKQGKSSSLKYLHNLNIYGQISATFTAHRT